MASTKESKTVGEDVDHLTNHHNHNPALTVVVNNDDSDVYIPAPPLASSRYNRQMLVPSISVSGQEKIARSSILIVGLGGLGSPAALYLAGAGVGKLGLLDNDTVELSNLHRQIVHRESSVGEDMTKVQSAMRGCAELNHEIELVPHEMRLDVSANEKAETLLKIFNDYDLVLDCTDNPATRYLISDLCVLTGKTLVSGAAQRLEGQMLVLNYPMSDSKERGPCYRCVFPTPPSPEMVRSCSEIGILGPAVGTIGTLMASEAVRLIVKGEADQRKPSMLLYNAWPIDPRNMFRAIGLRGRRKDCIACCSDDDLRVKKLKKISKQELMAGGMDYATFCGVLEDVKLLQQENRVEAADFLAGISTSTFAKGFGQRQGQEVNKTVVVDVREPFEVEMGPQIKSSINIPISTILQQDDLGPALQGLLKSDSNMALIFVCPQGNDSQVAAKKVIDWKKYSATPQDNQAQEPSLTTSNIFIGDVIGGFVAIERARSNFAPTTGIAG